MIKFLLLCLFLFMSSKILVEDSFPNTRRRSRVVNQSETFLSPLELACDKLIFKSKQLRRTLEAASATGEQTKRLDVKGLQLLLQGAIQPTVSFDLFFLFHIDRSWVFRS